MIEIEFKTEYSSSNGLDEKEELDWIEQIFGKRKSKLEEEYNKRVKLFIDDYNSLYTSKFEIIKPIFIDSYSIITTDKNVS